MVPQLKFQLSMVSSLPRTWSCGFPERSFVLFALQCTRTGIPSLQIHPFILLTLLKLTKAVRGDN